MTVGFIFYLFCFAYTFIGMRLTKKHYNVFFAQKEDDVTPISALLLVFNWIAFVTTIICTLVFIIENWDTNLTSLF